MPTVPPNTLNDLPRDVRKEFEKLAFERSVLGYTFGYSRLLQHFIKAGMTPEDARANVESCVVAWKSDECTKLKEDINQRITTLYTENGIDKTLRYSDPFGREKDYIMMEGVSTSFSRNKAMEIGVAGIYRWFCPKCEQKVFTTSNRVATPCPTVKVDAKGKEQACKGKLVDANQAKEFTFNAEALTALFDLAITKSTYVTLQARDVKAGK